MKLFNCVAVWALSILAVIMIFIVMLGDGGKTVATEPTPAPNMMETPVAKITPEPVPPKVEVTAPTTPEPTPEPMPVPTQTKDWTAEAEYIAQTVYGEARGCGTMEQAAVVWCILNRVDSEISYFPDDIIGVVTQEQQFHGYSPKHPILPELVELALDVIGRWQMEKEGEIDVGRVLPAGYLFFYGDGLHNHFQKEYRGKELWDWSLPNPYVEER